MGEFTSELKQLQEQVARMQKLQAILQDLSVEKASLSEEARRLKAIAEKEQRDVARLEHISLAAIMSSLVGKKDEKLRREQAEAYAAVLKHENAVKRLTALTAEIAETEQAIACLDGCHARFKIAVDRKLSSLRASGELVDEAIYHLEERLAFIENQQREIKEAQVAGEAAMKVVKAIKKEVNSAQNWGFLDMIGGGMLVSMTKHTHLDKMQAKIDELQSLLDRFQRELADIQITGDIRVRTDDFLRFADYFFDSLFVDWLVQDQINATKKQVEQLADQVVNTTQKLAQLSESLKEEQQTLRKELEQTIVSQN